MLLPVLSDNTVSASGAVVKNPPTSGGDARVRFDPWGREDTLEEETATHSSILAWRIPRTEQTGGLQSTGMQRAGHD